MSPFLFRNSNAGQLFGSKIQGFLVMGIGGICAFSEPLANSFLISYYEKHHSLKSGDKVVKLSSKLQFFADNVLSEARINDAKKLKINFFCSKGVDTDVLGTTTMIRGARIGIPLTYNYDSPQEVDAKVIESLIKGEFESNDWASSDYGKKLIESLVLSEAAKKFAIARGIIYSDTTDSFFKHIISMINFFVVVIAYNALLPLAHQMLGIIGPVVSLGIIVTGALALTFCLRELVDNSFVKSADARVVKHPKEVYRQGAIEYYEKIIERNKLLRRLLKNGPKYFNGEGDPINWYAPQGPRFAEKLCAVKREIENWKTDEPVV